MNHATASRIAPINSELLLLFQSLLTVCFLYTLYNATELLFVVSVWFFA